VLRITAELTGTRGPVVLPDAAVAASEGLMRVLEKVLPVPADYRSESLRVSRATYLGTPAKAQAELGWSARDLRAGLVETVEFDARG